MKFKIFLFLVVVFSIWLLAFNLANISYAVSESDCLNKSVSELTQGEMDDCLNVVLPRIASAYAPAQEKNKQDLATLRKQLSDLDKRIASISNQLKKTEVEITTREEDLAYAQRIFEEKAAGQYKFIRLYDPLLPFFSANDAARAFREISFRQKAADEDRKTMEGYGNDLLKLKNDKANLEKNKASLASLEKQVSEKEKFLAGEVAKVDAYLATLSAKQQAFIAAKLESLGLSRSAYNMKGGCSSDINPFKSPGFSPSFAFFTFGVPNRVGMNQYGAWGRAKANQDYDQILRVYYNFDSYQDFSGITIRVNNGNGINKGSIIWSGSLEDYVRRIYEVPDSWTDHDSAALKAQAIAARSYVLASTNNGSGSICANEYCQVFKTDPKGGNWEGAVSATTGKVMVQGGQPIKSWFSATHGGYAYTSADIGWSATSWTKRLVDATGGIGSFSDLMNSAFDKDSPVFYCDWGSRSQYNKTAWLKPEEIADIGNVILLAKADGSTQKHLAQADKPNPDGVDTWDEGRVRSELSGRGIIPLGSVSSVSIGADFGSGKTTTVTIDGRSFDGQDFKTYFNLRAPSNIQIVGPLFNIEKR